MKKLINLNNLEKEDILKIWQLTTDRTFPKNDGDIAWSFEGAGIRTRTTFLQAFQKLGLPYVELPGFLKTSEPVEDLAGYMDPFFSLYVIRDSNHGRMKEFAEASRRPLVNAMSSEAHPCEVLTDAYYLHSRFGDIEKLEILLWGPTTNVFKSWYALSEVLDLRITQYCPEEFHQNANGIKYTSKLSGKYDVVTTDAWPSGFEDSKYSLSEQDLVDMGSPLLLPTPPVTVGQELQFSPRSCQQFTGYDQKELLLPVQQAIISYLLQTAGNTP